MLYDSLFILGKPTAAIVKGTYPTILAGEDIKLTCKVSGLRVEVNWKKNGLSVPKNENVRVSWGDDSSTLVINNVGARTVATILAKHAIQRATAPQLSRSELWVQYFCFLQKRVKENMGATVQTW